MSGLDYAGCLVVRDIQLVMVNQTTDNVNLTDALHNRFYHCCRVGVSNRVPPTNAQQQATLGDATGLELNTLRTGSFKLFKRPLPGFLTNLTL